MGIGNVAGNCQGRSDPPWLDPWLMPLDKEHPLEPAFAEFVTQDAEGEKREQNQQHDEVSGERLLQP